MRTCTQNLPYPCATGRPTPARTRPTLTALGAEVRDSGESIVMAESQSAPGLMAHRRRERESVRVFVLPPGAKFGWLGFRRSLEQEAVVRRDERVRRRHGVGVVHGAVLAGEGDPARVLAQTVLQLSPDLMRPLLKRVGRVVDHLLDLGDLLCLLLGQ